MPWQGSAPNKTFQRTDGTRTGSQTWQEADAAGVDIVSDDHDTHDQDIADGLSSCLLRDGGNTATANIPMGGFRHTNLGDAAALTQALTVKQHINNAGQYCTVSGTANVITLTTGFSTSAYTAGQTFSFIVGSTNTGSVTVNVDSLGAKSLVRADGSNTALEPGDLGAGALVEIQYDGTRFQLRGPSTTATSADILARIVKTGSIVAWPHSTVPAGWLECYGQAISRTTYAELYAAIGTTYGVGDGSTTFNLPDMRGRSIFGEDDMGGSSADRITTSGSGFNGDTLGATGGAETVTLARANLPNETLSSTGTTASESHRHFAFADVAGTASVSASNQPARAWVAGSQTDYSILGSSTAATVGRTSETTVGPLSVTATGNLNGGVTQTAVNKMPPAIILKWIILALPAAASASTLGVHGLQYVWNTATSGDPGLGKLLVDNGTLSSATSLNISETDNISANVSAYLATWDDSTSSVNGFIHVSKVGAPGTFAIFSTSGSLTDNGSYDTFTVAHIASAGTLANGDSVSVLFYRTGNDGLSGSDGGIRWAFDDSTTTNADPGAGNLRLNDASLPNVTEIAISYASGESGNPSVENFVKAWDDSTSTIRGYLIIKSVSAAENFSIYSIVSSITDGTTYGRVTISHVSSSGTFAASDILSIQFYRNGDRGDSGVDLGQVTVPDSTTIGNLVSWGTADGSELADSGVPSQFTQAGTGAVERTWLAKLRERVSVLDFGAVGDGSTDDTAAFGYAVATGKAVYIPAGYTLSVSAATYTAGMVVFGDGPDSVIKWRNTSGSDSLFKFTTTQMDVWFRDLTIDGNSSVHTDTSSYFAAIDFQAPTGSGLRLERVNFTNGRIVDVRVVGPTASGESVFFNMEFCTFSDGLVGSATRAAQCVSVLDAVHWRCVNNSVTLSSKPAAYGRAGFVHDGVNRNGTDERGTLIAYGNRFNNIGRGTADTLGCIDVYYGADRVAIYGNTADQVCGRFISVKGDQSYLAVYGNVARDIFSSVAATATGIAMLQDLYDTSVGRHLICADNIIGTSDGYGYFIDGAIARTATMTIASPAVVTVTAHNLAAGDVIFFSTTGALPTGVTAGQLYYVLATDIATDTFKFAATAGGAAINTSGSQSGTHTLTRLGGFKNISLSNPVAGSCGIAGIYVRNASGVTIDNPMIDGCPIAINFTAIAGAFRVYGGRLANQTNDAVVGSAAIAANSECDVSIKGTLIEDCTDRAIDLSAVKAYDIDVDIDGANIAFGTAGSTKHSRIRGRLRNVTSIWAKSGSDTLTDFKVESGTAMGFATRELTIASGVITVFADWHFVDTEADAASDDLDTINGGYEGRELTLYSADSTRDVTLRSGVGNIITPNGANVLLGTTSQPVRLTFRASNWYVVSRPDAVSGPSSVSADGNIALYNGTGGKLVKDATVGIGVFLRNETEDQSITGGARVTSKTLGTVSSGTVTLDPGDRPLQHYTNNGAHTLAPGANTGSIVLDITNGASAGAITTSGWTKVVGDSFTTTNGHKFRCSCTIGDAGSLLSVQAMQ